MTFRIGIPREVKSCENRVALTPAGARELIDAGAEVVVQAGAGVESGIADEDYLAAGASLAGTAAAAWDADLVVKVKEPLPEEYPCLAEKTALFTYLHLAAVPELTRELLARRVTAIAYETVTVDGKLPLLRPMSEVAGMLSIQVGARGLERINGGMGILLPGVAGTPPGRICILGAGVAGANAARAAAGLGAEVVVLDTAPEKLRRIASELGARVRTIVSTPEAVAAESLAADLLVSTVLRTGERAPMLVPRDLVRRMKRGAVIVDVAIDQGGSVETSRPTTHAAPFFIEEGVVHYAVTNMPGAVPRTSTFALTRATLPWILTMARRGILEALRSEPPLRAGLNTYKGQVTCEGVARALGLTHVRPETLL